MSAPPENIETNPLHEYGHSSPNRQHSREKALDETEFELLLEGARELKRKQYYYTPDPEMTIYVMGRLGLRRGELQHLQEDWISWRDKEIHIPSYEPCLQGEDGGPCGDCRQSAKQRLEYADDLMLEEALRWSWAPKTEAGAREVYFGHDKLAELYIRRYFDHDEYDQYEPSGTAIARRVERAAELAPVLEPDDVHPHSLRASAATRLASKGMPENQMIQFFGWEQLETSQPYIVRNGVRTASFLDQM